mgnify:FL=1
MKKTAVCEADGGDGAGTGGKPEAAKRIDPLLAPFQ